MPMFVRRSLLPLLMVAGMITGLLATTAVPAAALHAEAINERPDGNLWQVDGPVRAMVRFGTTLFIGGHFTQLRQDPVGVDGGQVIPVENLAAIDTTTGGPAAVNGSLPRMSGTGAVVYALAKSGSNLVIGGHFATANGQTRVNIAAVDATSGLLLGPSTVPAWTNPRVAGTVWGLATTTTTIYAGGTFTSVAGQPRYLMAALGADGALISSWRGPTFVCNFCQNSPHVQPTRVRSLALSSDGAGLFVTGDFDEIDGGGPNNLDPTDYHALAELTLDTGQLTSWRMSDTSRIGVRAFGIDLSPEASTNRLYLAAGGSDIVTVFDQATGTQYWKTDVTGSAQAIARLGTSVVVGGHFKRAAPDPSVNCGATPEQCPWRYRLAVFDTDGNLDPWESPVLGNYLGTWDVLIDTSQTSGPHVYIGGAFKKVGGTVDQSTGGVTGSVKRSYVARFSPLP